MPDDQKKSPIPQTKLQSKPKSAPPVVTPEDLTQTPSPEIEKPLTQENVTQAQGVLDDLKSQYFDSFSEASWFRQHLYPTGLTPEGYRREDYISTQQAKTMATVTRRMVEDLKFRLFSYLTTRAARAAALEALGPIGDVIKSWDSAKTKLSPSQKNLLLNPNAILYYLKGLPEQGAFKLALLPGRVGLSILAHTGGPFTKLVQTSNPTWDHEKQDFVNAPIVKSVYTPFLRFAESTSKLADGLDNLSGWKTSTQLTEHHQKDILQENLEATLKKYYDSKQDYKNLNKYYKRVQKNKSLGNLPTLEINLKNKKKKIKSEINDLKPRLKHLFSHRDYQFISKSTDTNLKKFGNSFGGFVRNSYRKGIIKTARNLRRTERDPFSYLGILLGNLAWDFTFGLAANTIKSAALKVLSRIPQFNLLRARITAFFNSNKIVTTARMSGVTASHLTKGLISTNTAAGGYLGWQLIGKPFGTFLTKLTGSPIAGYAGGVVGTSIGGVGGALYRSAFLHISSPPYVNLASGPITYPGLGPVPEIVQWTNQYYHGNSTLMRKTAFWRRNAPTYQPFSEKMISDGLKPYEYIKGLRPGLLSRFSTFLWNNPYLRLPLNGLALRHALLNFLPPEVLATQINLFGVNLGSINFWAKSLPYLDYFWQIKNVLFQDLIVNSPIGEFVGRTIYAPVQNFITKLIYRGPLMSLEHPLLRGVNLKLPFNSLIQSRGYIQVLRTFLNPGFFTGFALAPLLINAGLAPTAAWVLSPVLGSLAHTALAATVNSIANSLNFFGKWNLGSLHTPIAGNLANLYKFNNLSWTTMMVGYGIQAIGGLLGWAAPAWWMPLWTWGVPSALIIGPQIIGLLGKALASIAPTIGSALVGFSTWAAQGIALLGISSVYMAIGSLVGLTVFSGFVVITAFMSYQEGLGAGPQSECFTYQINATITDHQTDYGGQIKEIANQEYQILLERSQQEFEDPQIYEQILFHQSITIQNQLYPEEYIQLENQIGPFWQETPDSDYSQVIAFKTYPTGLTEPLEAWSRQFTATTATINLDLDGPNTIEEISQLTNPPKNFYPTYYPQVQSLIEQLGLNSTFLANQIDLDLQLINTLNTDISNILSYQTTLIPEETYQYLNLHYPYDPNYETSINSLPQTVNYLTTLHALYNDFRQNHQSPETLQAQLNAFVNIIGQETQNLSDQQIKLEQDSEQAKTQFIQTQTDQINQALTTTEAQIDIYDLFISEGITLISNIEDSLSNYPLTQLINNQSQYQLTIPYQGLSDINQQYQPNQTLSPDEAQALAEKLDVYFQSLIWVKQSFEEQQESLEQNKKSLDELTNTDWETETFSHLPAGTRIDVFYTLTLNVDLADQPIDVTGGISIMSGFADSVTACRANNSATLNSQISPAQP